MAVKVKTPEAQGKGAGVPVAKPIKHSTCPISRVYFLENAKDIAITINGIPISGLVHEFKTGSFGWFHNGKLTIKVGEVPVNVQVGMNFTVVKSKEAPDTTPKG